VFVCPFDAHWCSLAACRAGTCEMATTETPLIACLVVTDMAEHWKPAEFKDTYHQDLMRRIDEKIKKGETKQITEADEDAGDKPRSAQVIDLAALLQQSLKGGGRGAKKTEAPRSTAAKPVKAVVRSLPRARAAEPKAKRKSA
jgi:DNA end-binding protein Ku